MNKRVLIVDDSEAIRKMVTMTLKFQGHEVIAAVDGIDALEKLSNGPFDVAIVDIIMPNMDGFELISKLKQDEKLKKMPIIMLSTEGQEKNIEKGLKLGALDFMVKPFIPENLLKKISDLKL